MNSKNKKITFLLVSITLVVIMATTSLTVAYHQTSSTKIKSNLIIDTVYDEEYAKLIPGKGTSVYSEIYTIGGHDENSYPVFTPNVAYILDKSNWWAISTVHSEGFETYLNRNPWDFPDDTSFIISVDNSYTTNVDINTVASELVSAVFPESIYSTVITAIEGNSKTYLVRIEGDGLDTSVLNTLLSLQTDGYMSQISSTTVTTAPVWGVYFGMTTLDGYRVPVSSVGWIDPSGITGSSPLSISTGNIFGTLSPSSGSGLSRIDIQFPYPIDVVTISSETVNPLPHVTGKFRWDQRHPISAYSQGAKSDYTITYNLASDYVFPNIVNTFSVDQSKISSEGTLEAMFTLTNIGDADASNIYLELPLGADFNNLANITHPQQGKIEVDKIKSDYYLDDTFQSKFNLTVAESGNPSNNFTYQAFELNGWYRKYSDNQPALWNVASSYEVYNNNSIIATMTSTNGFPQPLLDAIDKIIKPQTTSLTNFAEIVLSVKALLQPVFDDTFKTAKSDIYEGIKQFKLFENDFKLVSKEIPTLLGTETQYFMNTSIPVLPSGNSVTLNFTIKDIPTDLDTFASFSYEVGTSFTSFGYPNATLISKVETFLELMQYTFARQNFSGMPFFNFDGDIVSAPGLPFTYMNANNFVFFGQSNGLNLQVADNQAVLMATVANDKSNYNVGDTQVTNVTIKNVGNAKATNVLVELKLGVLGRNFVIDREDQLNVTKITEIGIGETVSFNVSTSTDSFLGFRPVYAEITFTTEADELSDPVIQDFYNLGINSFPFGSSLTLFTTSNIAGSLLLPAVAAAEPAIPEANFLMNQSISGSDLDYTVTLEISNEGDADGEFNLYWDFTYIASHGLESITNIKQTHVDGTASSATCVSFIIDNSCDDFSLINYLGSGNSTSITLDLHFAALIGSGAVIPGATLSFINKGESSLGDSLRLKTYVTVSSPLTLDLYDNSQIVINAESQAESQGQKSGSEDSEQSSYSVSSRVGASVNTEGGVKSEVSGANFGFIGFSSIEVLGLMIVPIISYVIYRRKR